MWWPVTWRPRAGTRAGERSSAGEDRLQVSSSMAEVAALEDAGAEGRCPPSPGRSFRCARAPLASPSRGRQRKRAGTSTRYLPAGRKAMTGRLSAR